MDSGKLVELLYRAFEVEKGGVEVYETALRCAFNAELREEFERYRDQSKRHVDLLAGVLVKLGLEPRRRTPAAEDVRIRTSALVRRMETALSTGDTAAAQLTAVECVVRP